SGKELDFGARADIKMPLHPQIEFTKTAGEVVRNANGTYAVPIRLDITNVGQEEIIKLQLKDDLDIFESGHLVEFGPVEVLSGDLTLNPEFDGIDDVRLLDGSDTLAIGHSASLQFGVTFDAAGEPGPFTNWAIAWTEGKESGIGIDIGGRAAIELPADPPDPPGEVDIEIIKTAGAVTELGDGNLSVPITLTVRNTGEVGLTDLQIDDNLEIFGGGEFLGIVEDSLGAPGLSLRAGYDGSNDINLLTESDPLNVLAVGETKTVTFTVLFNPGDEEGPFLNIANTSANGGGVTVSDNDAAEIPRDPVVDPPDPPGEVDIEITKTAGASIANSDGSFSSDITLTVTNRGGEVLNNLQITDDLDIFGPITDTAQRPMVEGPILSTLNLNDTYNGLENIDLLGDGNSLGLIGSGAESATLRFTVRFYPGDRKGPFKNSATATAIGETTSTAVSDDDSALIRRPPLPEPAIEITKTAGASTDNGDGSFSAPIELVVTNIGNQVLNKVQIDDDLDIFGPITDPARRPVVEGPILTTLILNDTYNGLENIDLLGDGNTLGLIGSGNESATLKFTVRFYPGDDVDKFLNVANAKAVSEESSTAVSDSGSAYIRPPPLNKAAIEIIKLAGDSVDNEDGSFSAPITLTVTNIGNEVLHTLQIEDNLNIFGLIVDPDKRPMVEGSVESTLTPSKTYNGLSDIALLSDGNTLGLIGSGSESATVSFMVRFHPGLDDGPFMNVAKVTAISELTRTEVDDDDHALIRRPPVRPTPVMNPLVTVSKVADRNTVARGDLVGYDVTISNLTGDPVDDVIVTDSPPSGFRFTESPVIFIRSGPDGRLFTDDDLPPATIAATGVDPVKFEAFNMSPDERVLIRYTTRVGTGVANGEHTNIVTVTPPQIPPIRVPEKVTVIGDPIFEKTTVIGKVFNDLDGDGWQDEKAGELGVPGVRLATVSGLTVETDAMGRYHIADVDVKQFDRGANFIIKVDTHTLPDGTAFISENPQVIRLTQATMSKVNFAIQLSNYIPEFCDENCFDQQQISGEPEIVAETATATRILVSGGEFGCNALVAETLPGVLPGRQANGNLRVDSEVTVFATGVANSDRGTSCRDYFKSQRANPNRSDTNGSEFMVSETVTIGRYPIELTTDQGSKLWITAAGDVIRKDDPENAEHIIVTPFRDDTDNSVISALRVANDGIEPIPTQMVPSLSVGTWSRQAMATADPFVIDPRLDVLALNEALVNEDGNLHRPIHFAMYTNYQADIESYALDVYGTSEHGDKKELLKSIRFSEYHFDRPIIFDGSGNDTLKNLSSFTEIEYVMRASGCPLDDDSNDSSTFDDTRCNVDSTAPRQLELRAGADDAAVLHDRTEIWGQNNLADRDILVEGSRVRISDLTDQSKKSVRVNRSYVPVGEENLTDETDKKPFVLEQYRPPVLHAFEMTSSQNSDSTPPRVFSADAHGIRVDGGLFGCEQILVESLPGRSETGTESPIRAITVVAQPDRKVPPGSVCTNVVQVGSSTQVRAGEYPIRISTDEGTVIYVTAAGDVQPAIPANNEQQIVVTPFRDHTDSSVVSALRISNEGISSRLDSPPPPPPLIATAEADTFFIVALANLTVGQNNLSGNVQPLSADDHFDGTTYVDSRVAMYAKGKIQGKYLITAQLDSTEDELKNLGNNLQRKDPRRIFRQLDPDRYYPVYGDDSTTTTDVDTQGAMYVRVDWDKNSALWGNYNTGMTDTEFMQYNRSLYGARFEHESQNATEFGDARRELTVFGSEAQSVAAHVTFKATGGSLYYLRDIDIVQGSEKVWVEVRRRDTNQVLEREVLIEGRDYEIDALQGRIILRRPLSQVVNERGNSIIRSAPLEGDEVFLLADYEYVPAAFSPDELTYGGRGRTWLSNNLGIGVTAVTDGRNGTDYNMEGVDLTLKKGDETYLRAEFARSRSRQSDANFASIDGGLTFQSQTPTVPGDALDGDAIAIDARADLADVAEFGRKLNLDIGKKLQGDIQAWWKTRDAEFSTGRLGQGVNVNDRGFEVHAQASDQMEIAARHTDYERENLSRERVTKVQIDHTLDDNWKAGLEVRHEKVESLTSIPGMPVSSLNGAVGDGEALLIGARVAYEVTDDNEFIGEDTTVYSSIQTVADDKGVYEENDLISVGINTEVDEGLAVNIEVSDGDRGSALIAGVDIATKGGMNFNVSGGVGSGAISQFSSQYELSDGHELYGSYAVDPDRTFGERNLLTLGQRRSFGNNLALFAESQFGKNDRYANVAHVFGLNFDGTENWRYSAALQFSENETQGSQFDRRALSFGAYRDSGDFKLASRVEYREDDGVAVHSRQYVSSNSFTKQDGEDKRWLGQLNLSWTDDELNGGRDARFVEFDIGHAYRPVVHDQFNLVAKYSFLYDLPTEGQATIRPDERSHLISVEGIYDLRPARFDSGDGIHDLRASRWELAGKLAVRKGDRRLMRDAGPWEEFGLRLASVRARYRINNDWDGLAEYRWLSDINGDNDRHGALLAGYYNLNDYMKVGVGFNFSDFNDRLRIDNYENRGWFIDIIGKY
ncbi:MAG: hypothetical protein HKN43_02440, partial [Rhodothermales bacterium]|nr:hypothetical protein [Rhodothermales bacterium]